ncbi:MAG: N-acetyltransferase [Candidatus Ancillula trichonymphae]|jgi:predicted GNAT family acetyltransferase|nr:N-acetyltransferase [Candidatus Ancillula trichonymphae]
MELELVNNADDSEFTALDESGRKVGMVYYINRPAYLDLYHTEVDPQVQGKHVAQNMLHLVFSYIRTHNRKAFVRCSYIQKFLSRHNEYDDLLYN